MGKTQAKLSEEEIKRLFQLVEKTKWNFRLNQFENAALLEIKKSLTRARREIGQELRLLGPQMEKWEKERLLALADRLQFMTIATQAQITGDITEVASMAGAESYIKHNAIASYDGMVPGFNAVSLSASQLESMVLKTPIGGHLLNEWVERSFESNVKDVFKSEIMTGMLKGEGYKKLVKRFDIKAFSGLERDVETLTRSYVQTMNIQAMQDVAEANEDIVNGKVWSSSTENGSAKTGRGICIRCQSLDSKGLVYPLKGGPQMPLHPNCLVGETPVFAPDKRAAFVASYDGPVIEVGLTDGRRLSVTPNHMFLTPQGFISAKLMRQGDKVFDSTIAKRIITSNPNDHDSPSLIKNVVSSLSESSGMTTKSVPNASEYLHGDGGLCNGDIDIISPDSLLLDDANPSHSELVNKFKFDRRDIRRAGLSRLSDFTSLLFSMRDATDGGMGSRRVSTVFLRRAGIHHEAVGSSVIPNGDTESYKPFADNIPRDIEAIRNGIFGLTGQIPLAYFSDGKVQDKLIGRNSIFPNDLMNETLGTSNSLGNILDAFPGQVELADVLFVRERHFSGHVYDLQTFSSLYTANGLLSSNCRCVWEYQTPTFREMGIDIDEIREKKKPFTIRGKIDPETGELFPQRVGTGERNIISVGQFLGRYEDFLKMQTKAIQIQTLGPRRFELWKSGKVSLGNMTTKSGRLRLLDEMPKMDKAV